MKKRVGLIFLLLVLCLIIPLPTSSQAVGWSDSFNTGVVSDDWSIYGWNRTSGEDLPGSFSATDFTLQSNGDDWSKAYRTSDVANGSWIFDLECVQTPANHSYVAFVASTSTSIDTIPREYGLMTVVGQLGSWDHAFVLYRRNIGNQYIVPLGNYDVAEISGWYHINITRTPTGDFTVAFNGTVRITANEPTYTTSDVFSFSAEAGWAIDNIEVIPYSEDGNQQPPPDTTIFLILGGGIAIVVILALVVKLRK